MLFSKPKSSKFQNQIREAQNRAQQIQANMTSQLSAALQHKEQKTAETLRARAEQVTTAAAAGW